MKNDKPILFIDFDDVICMTMQHVEPIIEQKEFRASDCYSSIITKMYYIEPLTDNEYNKIKKLFLQGQITTEWYERCKKLYYGDKLSRNKFFEYKKLYENGQIDEIEFKEYKKMFCPQLITVEHFEKCITESHDYKDRFLEEVDEKYHNQINYKDIIKPSNFYKYAIMFVNNLVETGYFSKVYIASHRNVEREEAIKDKVIKEYMPNVEFIPIPFHLEKYEKGKKRSMTSKSLYIKNYLSLHDLSNCILIDNSSSNGRDWKTNGGKFIKYDPVNTPKNTNAINSLFPPNIYYNLNIPSNPLLEEGKKR